jgi:hypothetical protein
LCDNALEVLRDLQAEHAFELRVLDIRADEALQRAYFERVPVIALDGEELCSYVVDEPLLRARLETAQTTAQTTQASHPDLPARRPRAIV